MNSAQWHLFTRRCGGWSGLWLIADFDAARSHIVSGQGGGTYYFLDGTSGWYDTTAKGLHARRGAREPDCVTVTWPEIRAWSKARTESERAAAERLRKRSAEIRQSYTLFAASKEAQGCGPHRGVATRERALYEAEFEAWHREVAEPHAAARFAHGLEVDAFLATLEPAPAAEQLDLFGATA